MSFSETVPPVQNRNPDQSTESAPHSSATGSGSSPTPSSQLDSLILEDPFASAYAPDPFPAQGAVHGSEPARSGTVFERYQKLFLAAESARDHESAILAALDSAILGAPPSSKALASDPSERAPHRPRLRSFNFERDLDWSEEPPKARSRQAEAAKEAVLPSEPPAAAPLASEVPVVFEPPPDRKARPSAWVRPKRELVVVSVAAALVIGFTLGFLTGRGDDKPSRVEAAPAAQLEAPAAQPEAPPTLAATPELAAVPASLVETVPADTANPPASGTPVPDALTPAVVPSSPVVAPTPPTGARKGLLAPATIGFDSKAALLSLSKAGARAGVCVPPGEPGGSVVATVTFGRKGHVEDVALSSATFRGAYSSDCIKGVLSSVRVRPFLGESVTVRKTLTVR